MKMEFKRAISSHLESWKKQKDRKPLILRGARQVGKTTLIKSFAKNFKHAIFLNLERFEHRQIFNEFRQVDQIINYLFLSNNISLTAGSETILFIDEIQESPQAIHLLRYFYEDFPELAVIAAGSLLEFALSKVPSFPLGRVSYLYLHPLNFREYLEAAGNNLALNHLDQIPINRVAHKVLLELFNSFTIIGGMPEIVKKYIQAQKIADLPSIYESIWGSYQNDVEKYTHNEAAKKVIRHVIGTAPLFVDQRIKFQNFGNSDYRSREVGEAFRNLEDAKIIRLIYPTTDLLPPLKPNLRKSPRLQFLDTGLLNHAIDLQANLLKYQDLSLAFKGAIIPHMINQELISLQALTNKRIHFWVREKNQASSEVGLVYVKQNFVIPIEIKSGPIGRLKSLHQFIDRADHPYAVRMYAGPFSVEKHQTPAGKPYLLMNLPYYLGTKLPEYLDFFIENNSL